MPLSTQTHLGNHTLAGPFIDAGYLPATSGVYVITTIAQNQNHTIIDVGESSDIKTRVSHHDRAEQWTSNSVNGIYAWVLQCDENTRMSIENALRIAYQPACGIR